MRMPMIQLRLGRNTPWSSPPAATRRLIERLWATGVFPNLILRLPAEQRDDRIHVFAVRADGIGKSGTEVGKAESRAGSASGVGVVVDDQPRGKGNAGNHLR